MSDEIPFQIEHLIKSLLNKDDNVYVRANFRARLDSIRGVIDKSIKAYDSENFSANSNLLEQRKKIRRENYVPRNS